MATLGVPDASPLRRVNVEDALTDLQLMNVAQQIGPDSWRLLGLELGLREPELAHIERDHRSNIAECTYHMLIKWRRDQISADAAFSGLQNALINTKLGSVARQLIRGSAYGMDFTGGDGILNTSLLKGDIFDTSKLRRELEMKYHSHLCTMRLLPWDARSRVAVDRYYTEIGISLEDTSVRQHTKISLERHRHDIFTISAAKNLPTNRILLQGNPGSGKSTVVAKLALDWMSRHPKSPLKDLPLLFILPLHKFDETSNLGEAVREHLLPEDTTFTAEAIDAYVKANPGEAMLVLDGLDGMLKSKTKTTGDKVGNLVKIIENKRLTECTVLVTSQYWKVAQMKESVLREYTLLELEGFKVEDTFSYILSYFEDDEDMAQGLIRHIEASPDIMETLCPCPLFCSILCHLWEEDNSTAGGDRLGTSSKMTDYVMRSMWTHFEAKNRGDDSSDGSHLHGLSSEATHASRLSFLCRGLRRHASKRGSDGRLPRHSLKSAMYRLGKVALEKLISGNPDGELDQRNLTFCREFTEIGLAVGILSQSRGEGSGFPLPRGFQSENLKGVRFCHERMMQKCAAVYLASLWKKNHSKFTEFLKRLKDKFVAEEFEIILMLACGEDANVAREVLQHLASVSASHELILKCYFESPEDTSVDEEMARMFKEKHYVALSSPGSHSLAALKYFLKKKNTEDDPDSSIRKLLISAVPFSSMRGLVEALNREHCRSISTMSLPWCDLEDTDTPALLFALGNLPSLSELTMTGSTIGPDFIQNIRRLPTGCFESLETIELPICTTCAVSAIKAVFWSGQFPVLSRAFLTIQDTSSDTATHKGDDDIGEHTIPAPLRKISFSCSTLALHGSVLFAKTLTSATNLKSLALVNCIFHPEFFTQTGELLALKKIVLHMESWSGFNLESFLKKCPGLSHMEINSTSSARHEDVDNTLEAIPRVMPSLPGLNTIHVSVGVGCDFTANDDVLGSFCEALKNCKKLNRLIITGIRMTTQRGIDIIRTCKDHSVRIVCLTGCFRPDQDLTDLRRLRDKMNQGKTMVVEC